VNRNKKMAMGSLKQDMKVVHEEKKNIEKHKVKIVADIFPFIKSLLLKRVKKEKQSTNDS
jgi:hypothetical protein